MWRDTVFSNSGLQISLLNIEIADAQAKARNAETVCDNLRAQHAVELANLERERAALEQRMNKVRWALFFF